jgi:glutathione S-transferase
MALTLYGSPRSRAMRTLWTLAELGLDFDHAPLTFDDPDLKRESFLAFNPAGAIPTIVDDGFALSESLAINLYLAKKYGSAGDAPLYPTTLAGEADAWRWSLWVQGSLEPWLMQDALLADLRAATAEAAGPVIAAALATLERVLAARAWLGGHHFNVADLNVAAVLSPSRASKLDLTAWPHVANWLTRCYARPAAVATRERYG